MQESDVADDEQLTATTHPPLEDVFDNVFNDVYWLLRRRRSLSLKRNVASLLLSCWIELSFLQTDTVAIEFARHLWLCFCGDVYSL